MLKICVFQDEYELYDRVISQALADCGVNFSVNENCCDICIAACAPTCAARSDIVIAPGTMPASCLESLAPRSIVTYGLCCKNTLTVSSHIDGTLFITLQRALITFVGNRVEEQEFRVSVSDLSDVELVLAAVAVLILAGVPISHISTLEF